MRVPGEEGEQGVDQTSVEQFCLLTLFDDFGNQGFVKRDDRGELEEGWLEYEGKKLQNLFISFYDSKFSFY